MNGVFPQVRLPFKNVYRDVFDWQSIINRIMAYGEINIL